MNSHLLCKHILLRWCHVAWKRGGNHGEFYVTIYIVKQLSFVNVRYYTNKLFFSYLACRLIFLARENDLPHTSHWCGLSFEWVSWCCIRFDFRVVWNLQPKTTSHFINWPLWFLWWNLNVDAWDVENPHSWHKYFFSVEWTTMCAVRACFHLKPLLQIGQTWGASVKCFGKCWSHLFLVENRDSQPWQK